MLAQADPSASQSSTQLVGIQHKFQRQCRTPPVQALAFFLCGNQPAGESWRSAAITSRHHSPAGWLLQGRRFASRRDGSHLFVFVGASLLANLDAQHLSLHATIRQQAGSYKEEDSPLVVMGARFLPLCEPACWRILTVSRYHFTPPFASRLAPTGEKARATRATFIGCGLLKRHL